MFNASRQNAQAACAAKPAGVTLVALSAAMTLTMAPPVAPPPGALRNCALPPPHGLC
ncbi:hypothetical protein ADIMK_2893 [Marinobacterium lacunae]|uniref:Uncharacterized protein n=1 Tax=Marinobacterium lacunae TaxID=1232683 RepID=A0A081FWL8_9GAMM|nr:hypothetical protein ADIMK_2893 [Marinobacterium lacunae]